MKIFFMCELKFSFLWDEYPILQLLGRIVLCFIILLMFVEFEVISPLSHLILTSLIFNFINFMNLSKVLFSPNFK